MRIALPPYHAHITPQNAAPKSLWQCTIQREGSPEVVSRHEAQRKEDAHCLALLELTRLRRPRGTSGNRVAKKVS